MGVGSTEKTPLSEKRGGSPFSDDFVRGRSVRSAEKMGDRSISLLSQKDGGLDTDLQKVDQLSPQIMASSSSRPPVNSVGHCAICLKNCFRVLDEENTCVVDEYYQRKHLDSGQNTYGQALGQDPHGQLINVTG